MLNIVSLLVSAVAAVATVAAAWAALRAFKVQTSPDVITYISLHKQSPNHLNLQIDNIGSAPAYSVKVSFPDGRPPLCEDWAEKNLKMLEDKPIAILGPGQSRELYLGEFRDLGPLWDTNCYTVQLDYAFRLNGERMNSDHFPLELYSFAARIDIRISTQEDKDRRAALKQIPTAAKALTSIAQAADRAFPD